MSKKFDDFIECLELLCQQHGVHIYTECLRVYGKRECDPAIEFDSVIDFTLEEDE